MRELGRFRGGGIGTTIHRQGRECVVCHAAFAATPLQPGARPLSRRAWPSSLSRCSGKNGALAYPCRAFVAAVATKWLWDHRQATTSRTFVALSRCRAVALSRCRGCSCCGANGFGGNHSTALPGPLSRCRGIYAYTGATPASLHRPLSRCSASACPMLFARSRVRYFLSISHKETIWLS